MSADILGEREANGTDSQITKDRLDELVALASAREATKDYEAAADLYSQATEFQAQLNGEMATTNADLLYLYGRCLYHVAVSKSDVLGSKIPASTAVEPKGDDVKGNTSSPKPSANPLVESATEQSSHSTDMPTSEQSRPFFQFTGDENFDASDDASSEPEEQEADDEDDFANAFETLDLARVLYTRRLEEMTAEEGKTEDKEYMALSVRKVKERLADTYDFQAEILLEGENFVDAVTDLKASLELKQELYSIEDPAIAECHYKLSLALEFSSVKKPENKETESDDSDITKVDTTLRKEAEKHMELAIQSCKLRISGEEQKLNTGNLNDIAKAENLKRRIDDVKDIVSDMEQRLLELRRPPAASSELGGSTSGQSHAMNDILGSVLEDVTKNANDLTSIVRKKKQQSTTVEDSGPAGLTTNSKKRQHDESPFDNDQNETAKRERR